MVEVVEAHQGVGSATGKLLRSQEGTIDSTGLIINRARRAFDRGSNESALNWCGPSEVFGVSGAAALYSRKMIEDIRVNGEIGRAHV